MTQRQNCWEFKRCGREPGGSKTAELGVCPSATVASFNQKNSGVNGGRVCWVVAGTLCGGKVQGTFAEKLTNCLQCEFYMKVRQEEGAAFVTSKQLLR